jgi:hypothetical protein
MSDPDPSDEPPPTPLRLGLAFWLALGVGLACVIAGFVFSRLAPTLLPPHR